MKGHRLPTLLTDKHPFFHLAIVFLLTNCLLCAGAETIWGKGVIIGEHLKIEPEVGLMEMYRDNIYLDDENKEDDWVTSILPGLNVQFAFTPQARLNLVYLGRFEDYKNAENFDEDHHYGDAGLEMETSKGSALSLGVWREAGAGQPYSIRDSSKDYVIKTLYAEGNLNLFSATELFADYEHSVRRYDKERYERDDYDRDFFAVGMINATHTLFPFLLEYRYDIQENDKNIPEPSEFISQSAYAGFRWREGHRLTGTLRAGYLWSEYNDTDAYDGWATDTELDYALGSFTTLSAMAERGVRESTRSSRETLDYYIYAGGRLWLTYTRLDPFRFILFGDYENRDFKSAVTTAERREDDITAVGLTIRYRFRDWLSFSLGYRYRQNDSTMSTLDYTENRFFGVVTLLSTGDVRDRRGRRRSADIDYFAKP